MKRIFAPIVLAALAAFLFSAIQNRDKPRKGEWNFRLEKVWEVGKAGEDVFGRPFTLTAAEEERLYIFDEKNGLNYIFDKNGDFIKAFGKSGQGPGELIGQERTYLIEGKLAIIARNGIHFFSRDGEYLKTAGQDRFRRPPQIILSEDEFIAFPMTGIGSADGRGEVQEGLVYVFVPELDLDQGTARIAQIDIFSPNGEYLYRARLDFGKGHSHLFSPLGNLAFRDGNLYAVCVREDDTVVLIKYKAVLPKG
jgi:hypothetical protein